METINGVKIFIADEEAPDGVFLIKHTIYLPYLDEEGPEDEQRLFGKTKALESLTESVKRFGGTFVVIRSIRYTLGDCVIVANVFK